MKTDRPITRRAVLSTTCAATLTAMMSPVVTAKAEEDLGRPTVVWQQCVRRALGRFPTGGGYHTGRDIPPGFQQTAWTGLDRAVRVGRLEHAWTLASRRRRSAPRPRIFSC